MSVCRRTGELRGWPPKLRTVHYPLHTLHTSLFAAWKQKCWNDLLSPREEKEVSQQILGCTLSLSLATELTFLTSLWAISSINFRFSANFAVCGTAKPLIARRLGSCNTGDNYQVSSHPCLGGKYLPNKASVVSVSKYLLLQLSEKVMAVFGTLLLCYNSLTEGNVWCSEIWELRFSFTLCTKYCRQEAGGW